jgi:hypothetical protein
MHTTQEPETGSDYPGKQDRLSDAKGSDNVLEVQPSSTPEEERAVVRKLDMVILPLMCFVFFLQYLDKQSLSYAAVRTNKVAQLSTKS